jgi:hypothetical protein
MRFIKGNNKQKLLSKGVAKDQALVCLIAEILKGNQFSWWQALACSVENFNDDKLHSSAVNAAELEVVLETSNKQKEIKQIYIILT